MVDLITTNLEISSFAVSVIALLISMYSVWYTKKENRHSIAIQHCYRDTLDEGNPPLFKFSVYNDSNSSLKITDIKLESAGSDNLNIYYDYEPKRKPETSLNKTGPFGIIEPQFHDNFIDSWYFSDNFKQTVILPPNESISFTYYMEHVPPAIKITVTTDKIIHWFFKRKSFVANPVNPD